MVETDEEPTKENKKQNGSSKKVTFTLPYDSETEDDAEVFQEKTNVSPEIKSSFEKRQEKVILEMLLTPMHLSFTIWEKSFLNEI